jgi:hypothetical protein
MIAVDLGVIEVRIASMNQQLGAVINDNRDVPSRVSHRRDK